MNEFPTNPLVGQRFNSGTGPSFIWDGVAWSLDTVETKTAWQKNLLVNPAMLISQENGSVAGSSNGYFAVDQWAMVMSGATCSVQQVASITPDRSPYRIRKTVTALKAALATTDWSGFIQPIEGNRVAELALGTAKATQLVLRFGFKAPAGTYSFALRNNAQDRSYVRNFIISAAQANTDTIQVFAIPGDTTGTWLMSSAMGLVLTIADAVGTTYQGVEGWQAGNFVGTAANSNMVATNGNVVELFDAGIHPDPDNTGLPPPFIAPLFHDALRDCMRYCAKSYSYGTRLGTNTSIAGGIADYGQYPSASAVIGTVQFKVPMRQPPAMQVYDGNGNAGKVSTDGTNNNITPTAVDNQSENAFKVFQSGCVRLSFHWWANARM